MCAFPLCGRQVAGGVYGRPLQRFPATKAARRAIAQAEEATRTQSGARIEEASEALASVLLDAFCFLSGISPLHRPIRDERAARMEAFLRARRGEGAALEDLAKISGLSPIGALHLFRSVYGLPPHEYLTNLRVDEAKRLLRSGISPADAAVSAGFYDQSHMNRFFTRIVGLTPLAYVRAVGGASRSYNTDSFC